MSAPYHADDAVTLYHGDALAVLSELDTGSVDCIVTSPPYFGLRDYGVDGQIGAEPSPAEFVAALVGVFREARRVLADDGTLWLNLGDSYSGGGGGAGGKAGAYIDGGTPRRNGNEHYARMGIGPKNLLGVPWRTAFALQDDGWILRNDIIWNKPNAMPESVTDRLSTRHEHMFLLTKSRRYWFDLDPIREPHVSEPGREGANNLRGQKEIRPVGPNSGAYSAGGRNPGDVWTIATQPFPGAHFATMPVVLAERAIQAGCKPVRGACDCGQVIRTPAGRHEARQADPSLKTGRAGMNRPRQDGEGVRPITRREQRHHAEELRRSPHRSEIEALCGSGFAHYIRTDASGARPLPPEIASELSERGWITPPPPCEHESGAPGVVLDPFSGSGTTGLAAARHGRRYVGIDLNADYLDLSLKTRLGQMALIDNEGGAA